MPILKELTATERKAKVVLLGSGGLSIGQAGEFDYSGTQAIKAMLEENIEVILINPNIATVQTNPRPNVKVYLYPVEPEWVEKIIAEERPDAIMASFGGQTALNCLIALANQGVLEKYNVKNLGTSVATLKMTEDRDEFANKMREICMPIPPNMATATVEGALAAAQKIGYPVILRAAYALGGLGSGFADNDHDLTRLAEAALSSSPQVLIEKSLKGWKEIEYEVMRDAEGNTITICNMENFDPLGIHTGDSIVVCPSQSLSDDEYQLLRNASISIVNSLEVIGECNVQFGLDPHSLNFFVIEVNARLSRSSALASKASGYPIAYIAAKVVMGYDLLELKNPVTGITYAYFEPALDYVTVKIPRWDLNKFRGVSRLLGSTMKSVGEVMAIGRTFPEALQKAVRMVSEHPEGMTLLAHKILADELKKNLESPTDSRLFHIYNALQGKMAIEEINSLTSVDKWFLAQMKLITKTEQEICALVQNQNIKSIDDCDVCSIIADIFSNVSEKELRRWKLYGFGDQQIAGILLRAMGCKKIPEIKSEEAALEIRKIRLKKNIRPVVKKIDTTAAEYPSPSNYLYVSYGGLFDDPLEQTNRRKSAIVLGGGAYRIGTSVEFDWCAVSCSERLRAAGWRSIIINCNPETVSTDYNCSDRLYFEELTLERILDIFEYEHADGVITSMGGQLPNRLAVSLARNNIPLLGHSQNAIDSAENRGKFSTLLDELDIDQPRWTAATSKDEINRFIEKVNFPVLVRPSYVLSGAAMEVAFDSASLEQCLANAVSLSSEFPVVISEYIQGAREIELDGIAQNGAVLTAIVSEHIENAGVHSGDATMVVPAQKLQVETVRKIRQAGQKIAKGLKLNGPFNMQFLAKEGNIRVIECNVRAARSFPFVSKTVGINLANAATDIMIGRKPELKRLNEDELPYVGVKAAMFSFKRLSDADPITSVEMASTGEVGCIGETFDEALLLALQAAGSHRPQKGVLVSSGTERDKLKFLTAAQILKKLNIPLYATEGTAKYLRSHGIQVTQLAWPSQENQDVISAIRNGIVDVVINIPKNWQRQQLTWGSQIRQAAIRYGCSLFTNMEKVNAYILAVERCQDFVKNHKLLTLPPFQS